MSKKIFLDAGHGGKDPGAVGGIVEKEYNLKYILELGRVLGLLGFDVQFSRVTDVFVELNTRCTLANDWEADFFISQHFNAGGGTGIETCIQGKGGQAESLAKKVQMALIACTGAQNRGVKVQNLQVTRDTTMPSILIEGGFVDSSTDCAMIKADSWLNKYMSGLSYAICDMCGVKWFDPYSVEVKTVSEPTILVTDKDMYLSVRVLESKAVALQEQIIGMGYATKRLELA